MARVAAVERYRDLDVESDGVLTGIATLAAKLFAAPMAAVMLIDADRIWFLGVYGLDAEVAQIRRDDGLCGLVIAGELPHLVSDVVANPLATDRWFVRRHAVRFYACAPMTTVDGQRVGTVAVMDTAARLVSEHQLAMLEDLAALAIKQMDLRVSLRESVHSERRLRDAAEYARDDARLGRDTAEVARNEARDDRDGAVRDRQIAEADLDVVEAYATALQSTLLPALLPEVAGLTLATHYRPTSPRRVGGDFYDVFPLGGDRWGFFIGDVEGHGVAAAVATSLIRYTLRSAALHYEDPTRVLDELNAVMLGELTPRRFCTVIFGTARPHPAGDGFHLTMATGGHQPALLLDPRDDAVYEIRPSAGFLVGLRADATFSACSLHLRPGQTLLFYTDGLVEARRGAAAFDVDALADFAGQRAAVDTDELITDIAALTTRLAPDDDVAVLAIRASSPGAGSDG